MCASLASKFQTGNWPDLFRRSDVGVSTSQYDHILALSGKSEILGLATVKRSKRTRRSDRTNLGYVNHSQIGSRILDDHEVGMCMANTLTKRQNPLHHGDVILILNSDGVPHLDKI